MGKLIVIEGLDGSGKNTQTKLLVKHLENTKTGVKYISFPDYSQPSSALVKMYLNSEFGKNPDDVNPYAASSFYAVDRFASFKKFWANDYIENKPIVCDRYTTSNAIYQMCKLSKKDWDEYLQWLFDYEYNKLGLPKPNKVIYLEVPIEVSQKLLVKRYSGNENKKDIHESDLKFLENCKKAADYVREKYDWITIECTKNGSMKSENEIHNEILSKVK